MKREFLENFKVGDTPLPKEVVDAILAENTADITAATQPYADYDSIKEQLQTAKEGLQAFEGVDVSKLNEEITRLRTGLADKDREWQDKLHAMEFDSKVKDAITAAKGRNAKAIAALLDLDTLRVSKNQDTDLKAALDALNQDNGYLFASEATPPPYAIGTGGNSGTTPTFSFGFTPIRGTTK